MTSRSVPSSKSLSTSGALHVVGVGASAGAIESLGSLLHAVPTDSGMAFVVVPHLSPDFTSHMEKTLTRQTAIPIHRVENGMLVEPNAIYVLPAGREMVINERRLILTERSADRSLSHPIDRFFRSLANDCGRCAIGVVLSGTGNDGSQGVQDIHDAGGFVIAQDKSTAKNAGTLLSAIAIGKVDAVLPPPTIAEALVRHSKDGVSREKLAKEYLTFRNVSATDQIFYLLDQKYGIDFSQFKPSAVERRIASRIEMLGVPSIDAYVLHLASDESAMNDLYHDLLNCVAMFYRAPDAFVALQSKIIVGIQHDISEKIRTQQALKNANEAAKIARETKSAFLTMISHELRTPLTAILGFADMLKSESTDTEYLEKVDTIKRNGTYLLTMLNDILELSEVETGALRFFPKEIDIRAVMAEVESLMQIRASEMRVPLRFEFGDHLPESMIADAARVRQIAVNLINNALKFSDSGEVVVSTFTAIEDEKESLKISVRDFGVGISNDQLAGLFTPFNQASKPMNIDSGGTGLGLSISKRLAEGLGGVIHVESELGEGSCFTLSLPIETTSSQRLKIDGSSLMQSVQHNGDGDSDSTFPTINGKILLADDRRDVWRVGKYFLEKCGAEVTVVENGKQAVEAVIAAASENAPFALVLMDMQMPIMTGHEAVRELRRLGFELPIIALTADAMDGEREACIKMGCNEYFPKPIDGPRLMNSIASLIQQPSTTKKSC